MTNHEIKIKKTLQEMGVTPDIKGYHYLTEAIVIKERANQKNDFDKGTIEIYNEVAGVFGATQTRVERAMRHAVEKCFENMNPLAEKIFGPVISKKSSKVTVSCFVAMMAEYLEYPESEE